MAKKRGIYKKGGYKNGSFSIKVYICFIMVAFVLMLRLTNYNIYNISFDKLKNYFLTDMTFYKSIEDFAKRFIKTYGRSNILPKTIGQKNKSNSVLFPVDGVIEKSSDGGYFIIVTKKTDVISPCEGVVHKIDKNGHHFDITIEDNLKKQYLIENIDEIYVKANDRLKKGQIIGNKIPFELYQKDYVYFKQL